MAGRPLDPRVRETILSVTLEQLEERGYQGASIEGIARAAQVGKPTIYRRWADKTLLVYEAVFGAGAPTAAPDTGSLESDLRAFLRTAVEQLERPVAAEAIAGLVGAFKANPAMHQRVFEAWLEPVGRTFDSIIDAARGRGEVSAEVSPRVVLDSVVGMVFFRALMVRRAVDRESQEALLQMILAGISTKGGGR